MYSYKVERSSDSSTADEGSQVLSSAIWISRSGNDPCRGVLQSSFCDCCFLARVAPQSYSGTRTLFDKRNAYVLPLLFEDKWPAARG